MARTVGIDTDDFAVTAVELEGSYRRTRLARSHVTALSGDQSQAERKMAAAAAVAEALREHRFKGDRVLGHPCDEAVLRKITMPFSGREAIRRIIKSEVENAIHSHSIDDMVVDFHVLGEAEEGARVLAAAVPKVSLRSMLTSLQQEGVEPERVELDTMALLRVAHWCGAFEADGYPPEAADAVEPGDDDADTDEVPALPAVDESARLTAVLDLGARSTRVLLVSDGKLVDMRTIRLGDAAVIDAVARHHQITFDQAKDAVATCLVTGGDFEHELDVPAAAEAATAQETEFALEDAEEQLPAAADETEAAVPARRFQVTLDGVRREQAAYLQRLARELVRFLTSAGVVGDFAAVWVAGSACRLDGMHEMLSEVFGTQPRELDVLGRMRHSLPEEEAHELSPRIATAVGLALANFGGPRGFDFRQEDLVFTRGFDRVKFPLAITCMVGLFAAVVFGVKLNNELQRIYYEIGLTYSGAEADPDKPQFYGQLNAVLGTGWFEEDRYFRTRDGSRDYGYKELLADLVEEPVAERIKFVRNKLRRVLGIKEKESGIYEEVSLESGLAVLLRFFEVLEGLEPGLEKYLLCDLDLNMKATGTGERSGRYLSFKVAFRGDDFRNKKAALTSALEAECAREDSPFLMFETSADKLFRDSDETGISGAYYDVKLVIRESFEPFKVGV